MWEMASRVNNEGRKSAYVGVSWFKRTRKWHAQINDGKKRIALGYHDDEHATAKVVDAKARELRGDTAQPEQSWSASTSQAAELAAGAWGVVHRSSGRPLRPSAGADRLRDGRGASIHGILAENNVCEGLR
eukprot:COSAG04_NODE_6732_length_1267_cov_1.455479_2_plen_131_part_00